MILNTILNLYSSNANSLDKNSLNKMHICECVCFGFLREELHFWDIDFELSLNECCRTTLRKREEIIKNDIENRRLLMNDIYQEYDFGRFLPNARERIFNYLERPLESKIGIVFKRLF